MIPPRPALQAAVVLVVPMVALTGLVAAAGAQTVALGTFLGAFAGVTAAVTDVSLRTRIAVGALAVAGSVAGAFAGDRTWVVAACLFALGLCQQPLHRATAGLGTMLVVLPAISSSVAGAGEPGPLAAGVALGFAVLHALARLLGPPVPADPVAPAVARRHAVALAISAAACAPVVTGDFGHGYWLVLALAALLRPAPGETARAAGRRFAGTVAGLAVAAAVVLFLPSALALVAAAGCVLGTVAWALARDEFRQTLLGTPVVVLVASDGAVGSPVAASAERLVLVGVGAALAVTLAALLEQLDRGGRAVGNQP